MKEALFYESLPDEKVKCLLCPHYCVISPQKEGFCRSRQNQGGRLYSLIYGKITAIALDPIEKKPLYHYHPREYILSIGTKGCNLTCLFCQNWTISQDSQAVTEDISSEEIIRQAKQVKSFGIAYTYNEPFIWYEFVYDTARMAKEAGLENVLVSNGYVNLAPLEKILPFIDAMNIDLKSIEDEFYQKSCAGNLKPVLETIKHSVRSCHLELTNLVIPTLNDNTKNFARLVEWVYDNLGSAVPLHISRYFPCYKATIPATPRETLEKFAQIARKRLKYVYLGNV